MKKKVNNPLFNGNFIADVEAHTFNGLTYFYGSTDVQKEEWCSNSYKVFSTADFTAVTDHGESLNIAQLGSPTMRLMYAPDAITKDGVTYLFICGDDNSEWVMQSENPYGKFHTPIKYDVKGIDPSIFIDDDKSIYYFWGQFSLNGGRLNDDLSYIEPQSIKTEILTEKMHFFHEGSSLRKRNGIYYLIFADVSRGKSEMYGGKPTCLGYATSLTPLGEYTYRGVIIDNVSLDPCSWNNHGSINEIDGQWYVFYHSSTNNSPYLRRSRAEKISFDESGLIKEVIPTSSGAADYIEPGQTICAGMCCGVSGGYICTDEIDSLKTIKDSGEFIFRYVCVDGCNTIKFKGKNSAKLEVFFNDSSKKTWVKLGETFIKDGTEYLKLPKQIYGIGEVKLIFNSAETFLLFDLTFLKV